MVLDVVNAMVYIGLDNGRTLSLGYSYLDMRTWGREKRDWGKLTLWYGEAKRSPNYPRLFTFAGMRSTKLSGHVGGRR